MGGILGIYSEHERGITEQTQDPKTLKEPSKPNRTIERFALYMQPCENLNLRLV